MVSVKAVGKSTVAVKWSAVKGAAGYRVIRKTNSGRWVNLKDIAGASKVSYSDTKVSVGNKYTYTVRAYTKNKKTMSSYNKTGLSAVAGISTLKLSKSTLSVFAGSLAAKDPTYLIACPGVNIVMITSPVAVVK